MAFRPTLVAILVSSPQGGGFLTSGMAWTTFPALCSVLTTRYTTVAIPSMRDWEWTEVLHYDADIYSVVGNRLSGACVRARGRVCACCVHCTNDNQRLNNSNCFGAQNICHVDVCVARV